MDAYFAFFFLPVLGFLITVGIIALVIWIGYRLLVSAVRAGMLAADDELRRRERNLPPTRWNTFRGRPEE